VLAHPIARGIYGCAVAAPSFGYSKKQVDRAGTAARDWLLADVPQERLEDDEFVGTLAIVLEYRATFATPLRKVTVGLRQFVARESPQGVVAQRLKRFPTIVDKLARFPNMKLSRMEDVGGCRAILPGGRSEITGVVRRIRRNWDVHRIRDYIAEPKETGYRAVHVVVRRDDRLIEIQLRTPEQQMWAAEVDRLASRFGNDLKDGYGDRDLQRFLKLLADFIALKDEGRPVDDLPSEAEFVELWPKVRTYFQQPPPQE
jgi:putative GTP pyrophosphokinase